MDEASEHGDRWTLYFAYMLCSVQSMDIESQRILYENLWDLYDSVQLEAAQ